MRKSYYPPRSLVEAISIPRTVFEKNAGNPMFTLTLAEQLGLTAGARAFRERVTASAQYGLTKGGYSAEKIDLLDRGSRIMKGDIGGVYEALQSVEVFRTFYERFRGGTGAVPPEKAVKDFLVDAHKVAQDQLDAVYRRLMQDARDWHLIQDLAGGEKIVAVDLARPKGAAALA